VQRRLKQDGKFAQPTAAANSGGPEPIPAVHAAGVLLWRYLYNRTSRKWTAAVLEVGHSQSNNNVDRTPESEACTSMSPDSYECKHRLLLVNRVMDES
jgi:hypothetical protein